MRNRDFTLAILSSLIVVSGCHDLTDTGAPDGTTGSTHLSQPTPHAIQPQPGNPPPAPNWTGDATVVSVTYGGAPPCGWGTSPGATRGGVEWRIVVSGDSISLDEDMRNWATDDLPYTGRLDGAQFTASYTQGSDYAMYVCQFREATLSGQFTTDSTFVADETLIWGTPGSQTTVMRHWTGSKL